MHLEKPIIIPASASVASDIGTLCAQINHMCPEEYDKQAPLQMLIIDNSLEGDVKNGEMVLIIYARIVKVCDLSNVQQQYQLTNTVYLFYRIALKGLVHQQASADLS
jgi:hypothetical protein